jgi:NADH-quinone oxidoreductase subunit J
MTTFLAWLVSYWYLVLPLVLGFVAVVALLPQAGHRRLSHKAGLAFAILSMLLIGLLLIRSSGRLSLDFFFYVFAAIAVASAGAMIVQRNPVYSALYFALVVLGVCGLFVVKSAAFLAAATIIVYAGAIIVTFLFVIMLAQQSGLADYDRRSREAILGALAGFILLGALLFVIEKNFATTASPVELQRVLASARELCAPDRFKRLGREVMRELEVNGRPAETIMNQHFDRLPAWPDLNTNRDRANKAWNEVKVLLAQDKTVEAGAHLAVLETIAGEMDEANNRYTGLLSARTAGGPGQSTISWYRTQPKPLKHPEGTSPAQAANERVDHVNELGRTLFGDYLYAVEIAGTLLLIATLGAILIAQQHQHQRRKEVLA